MHEASSPIRSSPPPSRRLRLVQVATAVLVVGAVAASFYFRNRLQQLAPYGYGAIFVISLVSNATLILPLPGLALTSLMGSVYNPVVVGIVAGSGQALGELTGYMAGYSSQTLIDSQPHYHKLAMQMQRYGIWMLFGLALIPNPLFDIAGLVAGALRMPFWQYLLAVGLGKIIKNILAACLGNWGSGVLMRL